MKKSSFALSMCGLFLLSAQVTASTEWGIDDFKNPILVNQDGQKRRLYDDLLRDKIVVINFIFTTCTDFCPLETAKLRQVQKVLGESMGRNIFFYSITVDPANDTPEVLKAYAQQYQAGPGWEFLTGDPADIALLQKKFGLVARTEGGTPTLADHNTSFLMGNERTGRWLRRTPMDAVEALTALLSQGFQSGDMLKGQVSYSSANNMVPLSAGEYIFQGQCAACHSMTGASAGSLGPDLAHVASTRDRDWVRRWIQSPNQMLADKDSLALSLYEKYNRLPMPNQKLTDDQVNSVTDFLFDPVRRPQPVPNTQ